MTWTPFHFLIVAISDWMNREQQQVIDYLREEDHNGLGSLAPQRLVELAFPPGGTGLHVSPLAESLPRRYPLRP